MTNEESKNKNVVLNRPSVPTPVPQYEPEIESFECFLERLGIFFCVSNVPDGEKVNRLCLMLGAEKYTLLRESVSPKLIKECTFQECCDVLCNKFQSPKCTIAERYKFYKRRQLCGESSVDFITAIKKLSTSCKFDKFLDNALRDKLVSGLENQSIVRRLLSEDESMTFQDACKIVLQMETVLESAEQLKCHSDCNSLQRNQWEKKNCTKKPGSSNTFMKPPPLSQTLKSRNEERVINNYRKKRCNGCHVRHTPDECRAKSWRCYRCNKEGHISKFCSDYVNVVGEGSEFCSDYVDVVGEGPNVICNVSNFVLGVSDPGPLISKLSINGIEVMGLIDTGSSTTLISKVMYDKQFSCFPLLPYIGRLTVANSTTLRICGFLNVTVQVRHINNEKKHKNLQLVIVEKLSHGIIVGRDWLNVVYPDWRDGFVMKSGDLSEGVMAVDKNLVHQFSKEFPNAFSKSNNEKPIRNFKVDINLMDHSVPVFHKAYNVPYALRSEVCQELDRLESDGVISKVKYSQWASPLVCVPKKNGGLRLCVDLKKTVNPQIRVDQYPVPRPDDILNLFVGCSVFCRIDLSNAFLQLIVSPDSRPLLTVNTLKGLYQYNRLVFGLASSPAIFQNVMDTILKGIDHCAAYFDDILIGGTDMSSCETTLRVVLSRLNEYNVKINSEKSEFFVKSLEFLGFYLSGKGRQPSISKVEKIKLVQPPQNITQLKSFLAMLNYYRVFIPMCSDLLEPLHKLLRKNVSWQWSEECEEAFKKSKSLLCEKTSLVLFDPSKPISVTVDSSSYGVGAVLSIEIDGVDCPVAFESATLTPAQRNYSQLHKEGLAVIFGLKKFHKFLYGQKFTIYSDHQALKSLFSETKKIPVIASARIIRWAIILSSYDYRIVYKKGANIPQADVMSRFPANQPVDIPDCNFLYLSTPLIDYKDVIKCTNECPILSKVKNLVLDDWHNFDKNQQIMPYYRVRNYLAVYDGCLTYANRIVIPKSLHNQALRCLHYNHPGIVRSKLLARSYVWWLGLDQDIYKFNSLCNVCRSTQRNSSDNERQPWPLSKAPWERIHLDFFYVRSSNYLIIIDSFSKWVECFRMPSMNWLSLSSKLNEVFSRFSFPKVICTDNGPPFSSQDFKNYCLNKNIKLMFSPPYNPQSNGVAERAVQTFKKLLLRSYMDSKGTQSDFLADCLFSYRSTPTSVTGVSPMAAMLAYKPRVPLSMLSPEDKSPEPPNPPSRLHQFNVGDRVMINFKNVQGPIKWVPGTVKLKIGNVIYLVMLDNYIVRKVHASQLRRSQCEGVREGNETVCEELINNRGRCRSISGEPEHSNHDNGNTDEREPGCPPQPSTSGLRASPARSRPQLTPVSRVSPRTGDPGDTLPRTRSGRLIKAVHRYTSS